MIGFKLKVEQFKQGELLNSDAKHCICHLVTDLDNVPWGCGQGGGVKRDGEGGKIKRQKKTHGEETKRFYMCLLRA